MRPYRKPLVALFLSVLFLFIPATSFTQVDNETCFDCHDDAELESEDGRYVGVLSDYFAAGVHGGFDCVDCHSGPADYEDIPHFESYAPVACADCHDDIVEAFSTNVHARAEVGGVEASSCLGCHAIDSDPHRIRALEPAMAEEACRKCHASETAAYAASVHRVGAEDMNGMPGCTGCHSTHGKRLPDAIGEVNQLCETCHAEAVADAGYGGHPMAGVSIEPGKTEGEASAETEVAAAKTNESTTLTCSSCHGIHQIHPVSLTGEIEKSCVKCHDREQAEFTGSVHEDLLADGDMECLSCHMIHVDEGDADRIQANCGNCHEDEAEEFSTSVHRLGRSGRIGSIRCNDCHGGHAVTAVADTSSMVNARQIPNLCGKCHADSAVVTSNFVRLPVSLPSYLESVHGRGWRHGKRTAVCTDCHGTHGLKTADNPESSIHHLSLASTCGKCHDTISQEYQRSIHGAAVQMGIKDAPTCNDCHDEHLIRSTHDPTARVSAEHRARELCGNCHTDPAFVARYGITGEVVSTYLDSYHAWAVGRGSELAATCTDCHNVHEIRSPLDPESTVHEGNVTETCKRCHERANPTFAQSYTHAGALAARQPHTWVRMAYLFLIGFVLGGMALHNFVVARFEWARHRRRLRKARYVERWKRAERMQHLGLLLAFIGLAVTGFALRYPDTWWARLLGLSGHESVRANLHRALAIVLTSLAVYHVIWVAATRRGRQAIREMRPSGLDMVQMFQNMGFHLGRRKERPKFRQFDYTQKAEYWALVWGTAVMALTGLALWYPEIITGWLPAWSIRVAEVIHFYEAILAVSAVVLWHFFYVIFLPSEYPGSTVWLDGKMDAEEWKETHRGEFEEMGAEMIVDPDYPKSVKARKKTRKAQEKTKEKGGEDGDESGKEPVEN